MPAKLGERSKAGFNLLVIAGISGAGIITTTITIGAAAIATWIVSAGVMIGVTSIATGSVSAAAAGNQTK